MGRSRMTIHKVTLLPLAIFLLSLLIRISGKPNTKHYLIESKHNAEKKYEKSHGESAITKAGDQYDDDNSVFNFYPSPWVRGKRMENMKKYEKNHAASANTKTDDQYVDASSIFGEVRRIKRRRPARPIFHRWK